MRTGLSNWRIRGPRSVLAILLAVPVGLGAQARGVSSDSATVRNEIERLGGEAIALFRAGDWSRVPDLFTETGVYVPPGAADVAGRTALRSFFNQNRNLRLVNLSREVNHFFVSGDIAMEGAWSTEEWRDVTKEGTSKSTLRYLYVFKRQPDGRWLVQYLIETSAPPAKKP